MGTTKTSGWAVFWFMVGFIVFCTSAIGAGVMGLLAGAGIVGYSAYLFKQARIKEGV